MLVIYATAEYSSNRVRTSHVCFALFCPTLPCLALLLSQYEVVRVSIVRKEKGEGREGGKGSLAVCLILLKVAVSFRRRRCCSITSFFYVWVLLSLSIVVVAIPCFSLLLPPFLFVAPVIFAPPPPPPSHFGHLGCVGLGGVGWVIDGPDNLPFCR